MFDLEGRVVLITGGNGGIGLGMAEGLAKAGAEVCIWGRNAEKTEAALERLKAINPKSSASVCDVSDAGQVNQCFSELLSRSGRVDGCFANAAVPSRATPFELMTNEEWTQILDVNLNGVFYTFRAAATHMKERARQGDAFGRLVATSSTAAISGQPRGEHYAASKGGLISMIKALAVEYARYGITANSILPGWIRTEMTAPILGFDRMVEAINPRIPVKRWGEPEDFAGIAIYLMSELSNYHTGDNLVIDGGYTIF